MDVNSATAAGGTAVRQVSNRMSELSSESFFKVLMTELQNQDPMAPNDSNALLQQLSSIRSIESQSALQNSLKELVSQNQLNASSGLIGKTIKGINSTGKTIEGTVESIVKTKKAVKLKLDDGTEIDMNSVSSIVDPKEDQMQTMLYEMMLQNQLGMANEMIGRQVKGKDDDDNVVEGEVTAVKVENSRIYFELDNGKKMQVTGVTEMKEEALSDSDDSDDSDDA